MKKSFLIAQSIAAAQAVLQDTADNKIPVLDSWERWNENLIRYAFDTAADRTRSQYLENLVRQSEAVMGEHPDIVAIHANAQAYIAEVQSITYKDGNIVYEPPFDDIWYPLN